MDDSLLVKAFQEGDEFAFVSLYNRYREGVYSFCTKMLLDRELAADVLQETFLRVYENRHRLVKSESIRSWIYTIARNQCLNHLRRNKRTVPLTDDVKLRASMSNSPISQLEKSEQIALVNMFLMELKFEYREVIVLREYQNLSYNEIAAISRSTLSSVKSRLFKARRKLAEFILNAENEAKRRIESSANSDSAVRTSGDNHG
ncbi:MAG: sigma-70 family RNA polymerase sigma factor [Rhodothermales bacterium]|nr:sigma-70 family RNA polymerase sigma factor [Rhodothermales bacterium]